MMKHSPAQARSLFQLMHTAPYYCPGIVFTHLYAWFWPHWSLANFSYFYRTIPRYCSRIVSTYLYAWLTSMILGLLYLFIIQLSATVLEPCLHICTRAWPNCSLAYFTYFFFSAMWINIRVDDNATIYCARQNKRAPHFTVILNKQGTLQ